MNVQRKLLAVLTVAVLTLTSGSIQAYASLCLPADKATQDSCCPTEGMQNDDCTMEGCDCKIDSQPTQQKDSPAVIVDKAPTWDVPMLASSEQNISFNDGAFSSEVVAIYRDRGPPLEPEISGHGLRAPPSQRA